jgi:hypothetical protein
MGCGETQSAGRSDRPNKQQRCCSSSCTQRCPAALPAGIPEIAELIDGAVQHAPHAVRQSMHFMLSAQGVAS